MGLLRVSVVDSNRVFDVEVPFDAEEYIAMLTRGDSRAWTSWGFSYLKTVDGQAVNPKYITRVEAARG